MPSLHVTLKFGHNPAILHKLRIMRSSSDSPDVTVSGGRLGELWTPEQDQRLVELRMEHPYLTGREFQKEFYPNRSYNAVSKRASWLKRANEEGLNSGQDSRRRQTSTPQYVYSDDEPEDMSLDSQPGAGYIHEGCTSEQMGSSKRSDTPNSVLSGTLKRKLSVKNGLSRPSPPKLSKTPTSPTFASMNPCSSIFLKAGGMLTTSEANTVVDLANNHDNHNNQNNTQLSNSSSTSAWRLEKTTVADIIYFLCQAQKCEKETRRAEDLAIQLLNSNKILNRYCDENRQLMEIQKKHDDEIEETRAALLKEQEAKQMALKELNGAKGTKVIQLKQLEKISQLKAEIYKIKVGSSKVIHPDMWRSGGMDVASIQAAKIIGEMEDMLM
ncbi:hypothetical protein GX50_05665 [[Emmonsia] crescens]|uniref:Myb-like domain-containing protein n=1 Tax=[Emmonsia] crescens TaxID=73230 RepID=A0A2B7ZEZ8_9EURO|nr:hypothetical protein GX50_05665 [Emmonsia crescens]